MILIWMPLVVLVLDRLTKALVVGHMRLGESIPIIPDVFHLTYILNPGAAFGLFAESRYFFLGIALLALGLVFYFRRQILQETLWVRWGVGLFVGGTLGNVWDRVQSGLVIDFLDFRIWPIFNVADMAICVGVGLIIWSLFRSEQKQGKAKAS